jgi:hypothetical protein
MSDKSKRIFTKGNVEVQNIKVGDIHYEYEFGCGIKVRVITLPDFESGAEGRNYWFWQAELVADLSDKEVIEYEPGAGELIEYGITEGMSHYGPNLYTYSAYS